MHEKTIKSRDAFQGRVLHLQVHDVELEDGRRSVREIIRHPGAVGVLVRHADGRYIFVKQYRKAVEDDRLEIVAGLREPSEPPEETARRELMEETGYAPDRLVRIGGINASPGYTSEYVDIFCADVSGSPDERKMDEDEHVETVAMDRETFEQAVKAGQIPDSKTLAAWLLYEKIILGERGDIRI